MDSFYIITNILKDKDYAVTDKICNYIEQKGKKWTLAKKDEEGHILPGTVPSDVECGLVLGGDGTLIRAIRDLEGEELPLLGINLGTLGYLAEVELKDYQYAIDRLCGEEHAATQMTIKICMRKYLRHSFKSRMNANQGRERKFYLTSVFYLMIKIFKYFY